MATDCGKPGSMAARYASTTNSSLASVRAFCAPDAWPVARNSSWIARHWLVVSRFFGSLAEASGLSCKRSFTPLVSLRRDAPMGEDFLIGRIEIRYGGPAWTGETACPTRSQEYGSGFPKDSQSPGL